MALQLPDVEHVIYEDQHLVQVVAQIRFRPMLRIVAGVPADFQDDIREDYPNFTEQRAATLTIGPGAQEAENSQSVEAWQFTSIDENWSVTLGRASMALTCEDYSNFTDFAQRFEKLVEALETRYRVPACTRVGLRYVNGFDPEIGPPTRIFSQELLGIWGTPLGQDLEALGLHAQLSSDSIKTTIRFGHAENAEDKSSIWMLDFDHSVDDRDIQIPEIATLLAAFHDRNYRLFRWSITQVLHEEMRPTHDA